MSATQSIGDLTDEDLREQLMGYGVNVGPIVSTTRLLYEKKLGKLIDSQGRPQPETESEEDDDEEEEEEDDEVQINYTKAPKLSSTPPRVAQKPIQSTTQPRQRPQSATPSSHKPVMQPKTAEPTRPLTTQSAPSKKPATDGTKAKSSGGGLGMWVKLLFIVFVAALVYLVIINMNPSAQSRIPSTLEDPGV